MKSDARVWAPLHLERFQRSKYVSGTKKHKRQVQTEEGKKCTNRVTKAYSFLFMLVCIHTCMGNSVYA